nr:GGDEF domain-containing protein [Wenzhouxiangella sp. XN201]
MALICLVLLSLLFSWHWNRQHYQLDILARRDALTGAGNRRSLELDIQVRVASRARGESCAIALLDLDNFKHLNDSFGHEFGDRVLVSVVEMAGQALRSGDRIYRFGGDEFAIVFPGTPHEGVAAALTKLHAALARGFEQLGQSVTVSTGAACLEPGETADSWLRRADQALYRAKAAGRDCFRVDEPFKSVSAEGISHCSLAKQAGRVGKGPGERLK